MIELLLLLLFNSLYCLGLHIATWHGNVLGFIRDPNEGEEDRPDQYGIGFSSNGKETPTGIAHWNNLPDWIKKPLYDCPTCMASIHSIYFFWAVMEPTYTNWFVYLGYIIALSGLNTVLYKQLD